jgi:hypothetical protein
LKKFTVRVLFTQMIIMSFGTPSRATALRPDGDFNDFDF